VNQTPSTHMHPFIKNVSKSPQKIQKYAL